jgi:LemA protein
LKIKFATGLIYPDIFSVKAREGGSHMVGLILLAAGVFFGVMGILIYNKLVTSRNLVKNAFSQIDVQLKRRYDLIPNLVETAKGYLKHEKETLENVIRARNQAMGAISAVENNPTDGQAMRNLMGAEGQLGSALSRLLVVTEAYPELKGQAVMVQFMEELTSTENKISFARQAFNDSVLSFNNQRDVFPNNILAGFFGFSTATPFEITVPAEKEVVKVAFS